MSEFEKKLETSTSFWATFTSSIAEIRVAVGTLTPDVAEDLETIQKLKIRLSNLQSCKSSIPLLSRTLTTLLEDPVEYISNKQ